MSSRRSSPGNGSISPIHDAILSRDISQVKDILEDKTWKSRINDLFRHHGTGMSSTPLIFAVNPFVFTGGYHQKPIPLEIIQCLIDYGADPHKSTCRLNRPSCNPVAMALQTNRTLEILKIFSSSSKFNVNANINEQGNSILFSVVCDYVNRGNSRFELAMFLLKKGAKPNVTNRENVDIITESIVLSTSNKLLDVIVLLLKAGAKVYPNKHVESNINSNINNYNNSNNNTSSSNNNNINANAKRNMHVNNYSVMDWFFRSSVGDYLKETNSNKASSTLKNIEYIISKMMKSGGKINAPMRTGLTPLGVVVDVFTRRYSDARLKSLVGVLKKYGASTSVPMRDGRLPLEIYLKRMKSNNYDKEMINLLMIHHKRNALLPANLNLTDPITLNNVRIDNAYVIVPDIDVRNVRTTNGNTKIVRRIMHVYAKNSLNRLIKSKKMTSPVSRRPINPYDIVKLKDVVSKKELQNFKNKKAPKKNSPAPTSSKPKSKTERFKKLFKRK